MTELYKFSIGEELALKYLQKMEAKKLGGVILIQTTKDNPLFLKIQNVHRELIISGDYGLISSWNISRQYAKDELDSAKLLQIIPKYFYSSVIPEEMGTKYDGSSACNICGTGVTQVGPLKINKHKAPKKDLAILLGSEIVVSEKFVNAYKEYGLKGAVFSQVYSGKTPINLYQLLSDAPLLQISDKTETGLNPFDHSDRDFDGTIYKCPKGHKIGLNILSELYVNDMPDLDIYDLYFTREHVGVKWEEGMLLHSHPLYVCSQRFLEMVEKEKLSGFNFEVTHIEKGTSTPWIKSN